jgi:hypothetical protein
MRLNQMLLFRAEDDEFAPMWCGPNDGGIRRGDRADTGDEQARPTEGVGPEGSGVVGDEDDWTAHPTANPSALAGGPTKSSEGIAEIGGDGDLEDLNVVDASDPSLGLTDVGENPPDDWAANTGPTRTGEAASHGVSRQLADEDRAPSGRRIELQESQSSKKHGRKSKGK